MEILRFRRLGAGHPVEGARARRCGGTPNDPFPSDRFDKVTLAVFFTDLARSVSPSFERARIERCPGSIDKLW